MLSLEHQQETQLRRYDRERRVRLIRLFAPMQIVSAILSSGVFLAIALHTAIPFLTGPVSAAIFTSILLVAGCYWIAYLLAGRDQPNHAAALVLLSTAAIILGVQTVYIINDQFGAIAWMLFVADGVLIVMAAAIGTRMMVVSIALACSLYMGLVLPGYYIVNGNDTTRHHELIGTILTGVLIVLSMAAFTLLLQNGFYRMARDTGNMSYAIERARQLDRLKDRFIISVNHELRNPLMALLGNLDTLERAWPKLDDAARQQFVTSALTSGKNVSALLESILDIRRIEVTEQFQPTAVDVRTSLDHAVRLIAPGDGDIVQRDLRVTITPGLAIWGDALRLQQILTNLLSNAIKYSAPGTAIAVQAHIITVTPQRRSPQFPPMVEITVQDVGLGIPPEQIPLLFQRFVRLERDLASTVVGNGLGLYLCREFAHAMQGEIWVESTGVAGEGSTFHLLLPASPMSLTAEQQRVAAPLASEV